MSYIVVQPADQTAISPKRREGDGGIDLFSPIDVTIEPGDIWKWSSRLRFQVPDGWHLLALQKSRHFGFFRVHAPLIDSSYRGEVHFCIENMDAGPMTIARGDAVMQLLPVFSPHMELVWEPGAQLDMTERGDGAFGSTMEEGS